MANTSSAKKAQRVAARRRVINTRRSRAMKDAVKRLSKLIAAKNSKDIAAHLPILYQAIDKAAKGNIIHRNTAARMKSRAARLLASPSK